VGNKIIDIIIDAANEINLSISNKIAVELGADAPLYGKDGVLDSLALVQFIVIIEQSIEDDSGACLTIADERAVSMKNSPFRTIGTLAGYIEKLLEESDG
jgi:acyl carrier protein